MGELAARAALQCKSMQEFLHGELRRMVARPSLTPAAAVDVGRGGAERLSVEAILKNRC